jgi:hypothetical protein
MIADYRSAMLDSGHSNDDEAGRTTENAMAGDADFGRADPA